MVFVTLWCMTKNLFVYGTLMLSEIFVGLTGHEYGAIDAELFGYSRCRIYDDDKARMYPAIVEQSGAAVQGKLFMAVSAEDLAKIDFFEDDTYIKRNIMVKVDGNNEEALVYAWPTSRKYMLKNEWNLPEFEKEYLEVYKKTIIPKYNNMYDKRAENE